jgi:hypothetical protein
MTEAFVCTLGPKYDWTIKTWNGADGFPQAIGIVEWGGKSTIVMNSVSFSVPASAPVVAGGLATVLALVLAVGHLGFRKRTA